MALLTVEIPERLLAKLKRTGRPAQEVIVEALEETLDDEVANEEITLLLSTVPALGQRGSDESSDSRAALRNRKQLETDVPREEVIRRLLAAGLIREPDSWDNEYARAWRELPEEEKQQFIKEMEETFFPDSFASRLIAENRR